MPTFCYVCYIHAAPHKACYIPFVLQLLQLTAALVSTVLGEAILDHLSLQRRPAYSLQMAFSQWRAMPVFAQRCLELWVQGDAAAGELRLKRILPVNALLALLFGPLML